jgi:hypothetical protein
MASAAGTSFVVECFWAGVRDEDLSDLDLRIEAAVADLAGKEGSIAYRGSMLIVDDEVILCLFDGPIATVRQVTERAGIAYERILQTRRAPASHTSEARSE